MTRTSIMPCLVYRDAPAAIDWLCQAFGFAQHLVVPGDGNTIAHAQLTLGDGMIMLGSGTSELMRQLTALPADIGGRQTQTPYVVVADPEAHYATAIKAGARIVRPIQEEDYGGKGYTLADPEGYVWHFGSYDPWQDSELNPP
ncbi:glyoxalase [Pigmentiphaga sp. H8]|uniref:VOC family protein n=1 Tax=unclassified Pigmentiphaga TaxID=2626614 RepID=UPI000F5A3EB5|nr:VOC family protein [Pigmentiphaga sp. H8]AZG07138.1 glyoxalase [Pigmentiphaga sp. H8]